VKLFLKLSFVALALLALPIFMTGTICHWRFAWYWNMPGQCGASDAPSEVFISFLIMSLIIAAILAFIFGAIMFVTRKTP